MTKMIDRLTTALNLFPSGLVAETLEALITAIKIVGHSGLKSLKGLSSMLPEGDFLRGLNQWSSTAAEYFAIAADYAPSDEGLKALVAGKIADAVSDRVFGNIANDLVVPEPGVYGANGSSRFPIDDSRVFKVPRSAAIMHTTIFGYAPAVDKITQWLA
jgi:hypothetical protein